jgi:septal ring factor EnvC (AmiA/AmiB activator)
MIVTIAHYDFSLLELGLMASLLLSGLALAISFSTIFKLRAQHEQMEKQFQKLNKELAVFNSGAMGVGQRLVAMEKRLHATPKAAQKIDYYNDEDFQPYSQAAQLFNMGLDVEEVSRRCGLSRAEVSLIHMMQSKVVAHS